MKEAELGLGAPGIHPGCNYQMSGLMLTFAAEVPSGPSGKELQGSGLVSGQRRDEKEGEKEGGQIGGPISLTDRQAEILTTLSIDPEMSLRDLAAKLGINRSAVDKQITALKDKRRLKRVGGTRGHWEVMENGKLKMESGK